MRDLNILFFNVLLVTGELCDDIAVLIMFTEDYFIFLF